MLPNDCIRRALFHAVYRPCGYACTSGAKRCVQRRRSAVRQEHRRGAGKPLDLCGHGESMAPAAQEQPQRPIPMPEGSRDTRSRRAAAEFSGLCPPPRWSTLRNVRCAAPPLQITTASLCCDLRMTKGLLSRCGFVLTSQFHYRDRYMSRLQKSCSSKGFKAIKPAVWAENGWKQTLSPMGEVCLNTKNG